MKRPLYAIFGVGLLVVAGFMIFQALSSSLVYFVLPSEYAANPHQFEGRRLRLGGIVEPETVRFDTQTLLLTFEITDSIQSYAVAHYGAPPDLFQEGFGVVVEGRFDGHTFQGDNVLVKHTEVYQPAEGEPIDLEELRDVLSS
jgi:cytochrome c-type biogenesis protein CcmE